MEARALGQSGQRPLWGQACQDSSDRGRPWGAGDSLPPIGLRQQEAQDLVQGRRPAGHRRDASGFNANPFCGHEA